MTVEILRDFDGTDFDHSDAFGKTKHRGEVDIFDAQSDSLIQEFYKDQTVFITGATGFLGSLLVEKLLRCCPQIRKLILLMRGRGPKSIHQRAQDFFNEDVFETMKLANPNYHQKVDIVCGQLDAEDLGLDSEEERLLTSQTTIVFHIAATVRFDAHMRRAYNINVKGTEKLLSLAKRMPRLKSFVHVSTAYCNCDQKLIDEVFYEPTLTAEELSILVSSASDEEIAVLNSQLLGRKPNTYTLTKAAAEDLVREVIHELPICVFRPSIVVPTLCEPLPIWFKGFNSTLALSLMAGLGISRVALIDLEVIIDLVPADRTINALIALAWYQSTSQSNMPQEVRQKSEVGNEKLSTQSKNIDKELFSRLSENLCASNEESDQNYPKLVPNSGRSNQETLRSQKETKFSGLHNENNTELMFSLMKDIDEESRPYKNVTKTAKSHELNNFNAIKEEKQLHNNVFRSQYKDSSKLFDHYRKDAALSSAENNRSNKCLKNIDNKEVTVAHTGNRNMASPQDTALSSAENNRSNKCLKNIDNKGVTVAGNRNMASPQEDRRIFNFVSYKENPVTLNRYITRCTDSWKSSEESNSFCVWSSNTYYVKQTFLYSVLFYILHSLPALAFSLAEKLQHRKPMIMSTYRKIFYLTKVIGYFCLNDWVFENANTKALTDAIPPQDRALFDVSLRNFQWEPFIDCYPRAIALYMVNSRLTKKNYQEKMVYINAVDYCIGVTTKVICVYLVLHFVATLVNTCWVF